MEEKQTDKRFRVYEVARDVNLSSEALVAMLRGLGYDIKSHMSVVTPEMRAQVDQKFAREHSSALQEMKRKAEQLEERKRKEEAQAKAQAQAQAQAEAQAKAEAQAQAKAQAQAQPKAPAPVPSRPQAPQEPSEAAGEGKKRRRRRRRRRGRGGAGGGELIVGPVETPAVPDEIERIEAVSDRTPRKRLKPTRGRRRAVDQKAVEENVRKTMAQMEVGVRQRRRRFRDTRPDEDASPDETKAIRTSEFITVAELAGMMEVKPTDVIMKLFSMGMPVTINQRLDMDTIVMVADEFGFEVQPVEDVVEEVLKQDEEDRPEDLSPRPPIVTIMGHVDHGKTSLLDYTRKSNIIAGEAGGITQHIGAYEVTLKDGRQVTFLDTPGHEAFTAMRARGARVTDVVVLVVSADDNVMPQTVEAINHARAAEVPIVVAINKVDLPAADPAKIKRQLAEQNVLVEEWGGEVVSCEISAKTGQNVDHFLELLALQTEILELKANPNRRARGAVVEAELDRGRGPVATVLVQEGTLRVGDPFVVGVWNGRVRAMLDERGRPVPEAGPSRPVRVLGISGGVPQAGDTFHVMASEQEAREIAQKRQQIRREQDVHRVKRLTLSNIHERIQEGKMRELRLIVKGDVDGSVEALSDALTQLTHEEVRVSVIHRGVGGITESDVLLALASEAIIIGFNVRPDARAREVATSEVDIRLYRVIYEAIEDVKAALSGLLAPQVDEQTVGTVEVRETFHVPRAGTIAGCHVTSGAIRRNALVRVLRDSVVIFEGEVASLRRFKDDVREVTSGFECGVGIENFNDVKVGDVLEVYEMVETARTV